MKLLSSLLISFVIGGLLLVAMPHQAAAACKTDGTEIATSFSWGGKTCFPAKNADGSINNPIFIALLTLFNFLAVGVGIVVTGGIIFGAIQYITANGNASQTQQGVTVITNSVIGLILFIFMYALLNFLVPGGLFK
jgi:hypothetical protein